ncbi:OLC1v1010566C1 [Oldenlandia corymbosa var. corymbosa]|uniref:OLC1v1010566C1 n=1 Tax=Oldenlandia corymbosa var. corymbosa TaxID=529605 RepID=A0AAV1DRK5_OLDCO|nr:OLC1v1010566C1 [Oldenlandia corymbosa var. corymbosa]
MAINSNPKRRVCFSYAAYTKDLIQYLKSCNVPIEKGLTDDEVTSIESHLNCKFPPDFRSVLQEGLPVGPGFPNWRSTSIPELQNLVTTPVLGLCKELIRNRFWLDSWGIRPMDSEEAMKLGKGFLKKVPVLIPVYRNFYIPATPLLAGNPLFYVNGGDVRLWSFDIAGFFHQVELNSGEDVLKRPSLSKLMSVPSWAATEPRRIEFWTDFAERGERLAENGGGSVEYWWSDECFGECLEDVFWRLRNGGWKEKDVREMMMMDDQNSGSSSSLPVIFDRESIDQQVKTLSKTLLQAGWSTEDVIESLGSLENIQFPISSPPPTYDEEQEEEESWFDCNQSICSNWDDEINYQDDYTGNNNTKEVKALKGTEMMNSHPIKV